MNKQRYCLDTKNWYLERVLFLMAGSFVLLSLLLSWLFSPYWLILACLVGINQVIFALTGFCPSAIFLHFLGIKARLQNETK